jgi:nucleotide-binding universal stress UspA family protein
MRAQLLVPIHTFPNGNGVEFAAQTAAIARHLDGDVNAVVLTPRFPTVSSALGNLLIDVPELIGGARAKAQARGEAVVGAMRQALEGSGIPFRPSELECTMGAPGESFVQLARYHDLVLCGIVAGDATLQAAAELAVFGSGRPSLLLPEDMPVAVLDHVMLAWDGSKVAARAVADARDFLDRATAVTIASVVDEKALPDMNPGMRLADYLAHRGVAASVARIEGRGRPIADILQEAARDRGAGLLVMGGFGHSRLRDFVLGGATSGVLRNPRLPILLSH